jgi:hypothetical protein
MMPLNRAKVQVNAIIWMCIQFVSSRLRRASERYAALGRCTSKKPAPGAA